MHCAALICRATSGVLLEPFQTSFLLQPALQEVALSPINGHWGPWSFMWPFSGSDHCSSSHLCQFRWDAFLPCSLSLPTTRSSSSFGRVSATATSLFMLRIASPLQNSAVPADLLPSCCSTSLCWLTTSWVNLMIFLFVLSLNAIQSDFHFLAALFSFMKKGTR